MIGFEQLEGREMLSGGIALTIIPTSNRPPASMPRPQFGSFNPSSPLVVIYRADREDRNEVITSPGGLWPMGGRFRMG